MADSSVVYTLATWSVKPGKEGEFAAAWGSFARWTMDHQAGAVGDARLLQDLAESGRFLSFGAWDNMATVQAWRDRPEFKAFFVTARALCDDVQPQTFRVATTIEAKI